jgi:LysM domain
MYCRMAILVVALIVCSTLVLAADIVLVKHARRSQSPQSTQYVVREGETLGDILTRVYGAKKEDLPSLYARFRQENPGIKNLDHIPAGSKVSIPLPGMKSIVPMNKKKASVALQVKQVSPQEYVIKQGQHLAMILREVYGIPDELIFDEYLNLIKELNPEIGDPNHVVPGQKISIPDIKQVISAAKQTQNKMKEPGLAMADNHQVEAPVSSPAVPPKAQEGDKGSKAKAASTASQAVRNTVLPALERMGGNQKNQGTYFMPLTGGTSISMDTNEIPVIELDTGNKIIFDSKGMITPEVKRYIEKAFPSFKVITDSPASLEDLMDKVLNVSGYFSINKGTSPLIVGEEEKVRFFGKWIVYKEYTRQNVFVINLLKDDEHRTPVPIQKYAGHFGIDLIEMGGRDPADVSKNPDVIKTMDHSYRALFTQLGVTYEADREIELISGSVVRVAYKAPLLVGKVILTETLPDQTTAAMLTKQSYVLLNTRSEPVDAVLKAVGVKVDGPPVKVIVAQGRTELEIPALQVEKHIIITRPIDHGIAMYIASGGMDVLIW